MNEQAKKPGDGAKQRNDEGRVTWGPKLFYGTLAAVLVFFWWLAIYSHGVTPME
jgi:hypothetical protein